MKSLILIHLFAFSVNLLSATIQHEIKIERETLTLDNTNTTNSSQISEIIALYDHENKIVIYKDDSIHACFLEQDDEKKPHSVNITSTKDVQESGKAPLIKSTILYKKFCGEFPLFDLNYLKLTRTKKNRTKRCDKHTRFEPKLENNVLNLQYEQMQKFRQSLGQGGSAVYRSESSSTSTGTGGHTFQFTGETSGSRQSHSQSQGQGSTGASHMQSSSSRSSTTRFFTGQSEGMEQESPRGGLHGSQSHYPTTGGRGSYSSQDTRVHTSTVSGSNQRQSTDSLGQGFLLVTPNEDEQDIRVRGEPREYTSEELRRFAATGSYYGHSEGGTGQTYIHSQTRDSGHGLGYGQVHGTYSSQSQGEGETYVSHGSTSGFSQSQERNYGSRGTYSGTSQTQDTRARGGLMASKPKPRQSTDSLGGGRLLSVPNEEEEEIRVRGEPREYTSEELRRFAATGSYYGHSEGGASRTHTQYSQGGVYGSRGSHSSSSQSQGGIYESRETHLGATQSQGGAYESREIHLGAGQSQGGTYGYRQTHLGTGQSQGEAYGSSDIHLGASQSQGGVYESRETHLGNGQSQGVAHGSRGSYSGQSYDSSRHVTVQRTGIGSGSTTSGVPVVRGEPQEYTSEEVRRFAATGSYTGQSQHSNVIQTHGPTESSYASETQLSTGTVGSGSYVGQSYHPSSSSSSRSGFVRHETSSSRRRGSEIPIGSEEDEGDYDYESSSHRVYQNGQLVKSVRNGVDVLEQDRQSGHSQDVREGRRAVSFIDRTGQIIRPELRSGGTGRRQQLGTTNEQYWSRRRQTYRRVNPQYLKSIDGQSHSTIVREDDNAARNYDYYRPATATQRTYQTYENSQSQGQHQQQYQSHLQRCHMVTFSCRISPNQSGGWTKICQPIQNTTGGTHGQSSTAQAQTQQICCNC